MIMDRKLEILLVEDDESECSKFKNQVELEYETFTLIGVTDNQKTAVDVIKNSIPDVVVLDLELHQGGGNGLSLLQQIRSENLPFPPYVLITTANVSAFTHETARALGADFIMTKNQTDYSPKAVLDFLKIVKPAIINRRNSSCEVSSATPEETENTRKKRIEKQITIELNNIGIKTGVKGFKYLTKAIAYYIDGSCERINSLVAKEYGVTPPSVDRAMQNAIDYAWSHTDVETLYKNYKAQIRQGKDAPTLMEFISYYAIKIEEEL